MRIRIQLFISIRIRIQEVKTNEDPDPGHTWLSQKVKILHENIPNFYAQEIGKTDLRMNKALLKCWKSGLLANFWQFPCSWIRILIQIRIQESQTNADPRGSETSKLRENSKTYNTDVHLTAEHLMLRQTSCCGCSTPVKQMLQTSSSSGSPAWNRTVV